MLLKVHPVQRCELSCHLLTCLIVQKGYVKVGRLYRWRTGEVPGQTERETERQRDRQTDRERERERDVIIIHAIVWTHRNITYNSRHE